MKNRKIITVAVLFVILALAGGAFFVLRDRGDQTASQPARPINSVNYDPPTKEEAKAGDTQKEQNVKQTETESAGSSTGGTASGKKAATITIADASQYDTGVEVRAGVTNVFESDGTCTASFTKAGQQTVTKAGNAMTSGTYTQCQTITTPVSQFSQAGTWQLTVSYQSATAQGSSTSTPVEVRK